MRAMLLVPGTGHFYCGSCLRDDALAQGLRQLGHEVDVVPLYLPLVLEREVDAAQVHMGGINVYLQQKTRLARLLPGFVADWLDRPGLLRWASRRGGMTDATDLGPITVSILRGEAGHQAHEIEKLARWVADRPRPDVVILSNALLVGAARRLRELTDAPVVVTLQGEAPFLDALPEPHRRIAWAVLRDCIAAADALVAVSQSYGATMQERLGVADHRLHVVSNGIDCDGLIAPPPRLLDRGPKTIGFLARMCRDKGLDRLVDAFLVIAQRDMAPPTRLRIAGVQLADDRALVAELEQRVAAHGLTDRVEFLPNVDRDGKLAFLRSLHVLSVPAFAGEAFGLYLLEAMAAGVPVVQPRHAAFPEIIAATGGGVLCEPDDTEALAAALERVLTDDERAQRLADCGRAAVLRDFTAARMAREVAVICESLRSPLRRT